MEEITCIQNTNCECFFFCMPWLIKHTTRSDELFQECRNFIRMFICIRGRNKTLFLRKAHHHHFGDSVFRPLHVPPSQQPFKNHITLCVCIGTCCFTWSRPFLTLSSWLWEVCSRTLPGRAGSFLHVFQTLLDIVLCVPASLSGDQSRSAVRVHNQSKRLRGQRRPRVSFLLEIWLMDWVQRHLWHR